LGAVTSHLLFYLGLGALLTFEEAGVFLLPGDISMIAAGVYAAQGGPFILISWLVATAGMVAGSSVLFLGVRRSRRTGRAIPERARMLIHRYGARGVALARIVPGLRNASVFTAAAAGLPTRVFLTGLIPAAMLWSAALLALGRFGGAAILSAYGGLDGLPVVKVLSIGLVVATGVFLGVRLRSTRGVESADL